MKELIRMRPNWIVNNIICDYDKIVIVSNFERQNVVSNISWEDLETKDEHDIGMWHVKLKELKSK